MFGRGSTRSAFILSVNCRRCLHPKAEKTELEISFSERTHFVQRASGVFYIVSLLRNL